MTVQFKCFQNVHMHNIFTINKNRKWDIYRDNKGWHDSKLIWTSLDKIEHDENKTKLKIEIYCYYFIYHFEYV